MLGTATKTKVRSALVAALKKNLAPSTVDQIKRALSAAESASRTLSALGANAVKTFGLSGPASQLSLAQVSVQAGRDDEAIEALQKYLKSRPNDISALVQLAQALSRLSRNDEALAAAGRALQCDTSSTTAIDLIEQLLSGLAESRYDPAIVDQLISAYRARLSVHPDDIDAWRRLGRWLDFKSDDRASLKSSDSDEGIHTPIATRKAPEGEVRMRLAAPADLAQADLSAIENENADWARLISAQHQRLGFLDSLDNWVRYEHTKFYYRNFGLFTKKFGDAGASVERPITIPENLMTGFSMDGRVHVEEGYLNGSYPPHFCQLVTDDDIVGYVLSLARHLPAFRKHLPSALNAAVDRKAPDFDNTLARVAYQSAAPEIALFARALSRHNFAGGSVATVSPFGPWIEAACLMTGLAPTRISPLPVMTQTSYLSCITLAEWKEKLQSFDTVVAYNFVEHWGLGRFGDPIDPDGDISAMKLLSQIVSRKGRLFLFLPIGKDVVVFNAGRVYGRARLPVLLDGWRPFDVLGFSEATLNGTGENLSLLALERA